MSDTKHVPDENTKQVTGEFGNFYEENVDASKNPSVEARVQALIAEDEARAREDAVKGDAEGTVGFIQSQQSTAQASKGPRKSALEIAREIKEAKEKSGREN